MKGYYLFAPVEPENAGPDSGVEKKVRAQHKALSEHFDCELVIFPPAEYTGSAKEKIVRRLPFTAAWRKWEYHGEFDDADFVYIRCVYHDYSFYKYLKQLKNANKSVKIIYEIPTYPYDNQRKLSLSSLPFKIKERVNRFRIRPFLDSIVTFYGQEKIWGIPCIKLMNGYDFSSCRLPEREVSKTEIPLISVASTAAWHGYNFILEGLNRYYNYDSGKDNVVFNLVGNVLPEHEALVKKYSLGNHVVFHGKKFGEELYDLYSQSLIGVNVLGPSGDGNPLSSSLKSREYAAFGLPMVSSLPVDYLPKDYPYLCLVNDDTGPIDIRKIVDFYHSVYDNESTAEVAANIRNFAITRCDMRVTMQPVADWIGQHCDC